LLPKLIFEFHSLSKWHLELTTQGTTVLSIQRTVVFIVILSAILLSVALSIEFGTKIHKGQVFETFMCSPYPYFFQKKNMMASQKPKINFMIAVNYA
jgi:hypothetical protein